MSKVIFHHPQGASAPHAQTNDLAPIDARGRPVRDLRISITDRCNFRCTYCMPREVFDKNYQFMPHASLLTFEEITQVARAAVAIGVNKIRLTGGEPLLRKDMHKLVAMLAQLRTPEGLPVDLTLTTNGTLLARKAQQLAEAGLNRLTVSLDALDDATFQRMSDSQVSVQTVLDGIEAASRAGLGPIKVNMVVRKGLNDNQLLDMARHFRHSGHILRFIEYMDVGSTNGWNLDEVITSRQIIETLSQAFALEPVQAAYRGEVAARWRYTDGAGEIGVITSVSQPFCGDCTRARLSPEGKLFLCLFANAGHDLRALVRSGASDADLGRAMAAIWRVRNDHYSEQRGAETAQRQKIEMSYIGG